MSGANGYMKRRKLHKAAYDGAMVQFVGGAFILAGGAVLQEDYGWTVEESAAWAHATIERAKLELIKIADEQPTKTDEE